MVSYIEDADEEAFEKKGNHARIAMNSNPHSCLQHITMRYETRRPDLGRGEAGGDPKS
jgi:hypothetical protein